MSVITTEDPESLRASAKTDSKSFREAVVAHRSGLLTHCYRFTGSLHDAEDMVQETFLRAWRSVDQFEGRSSLRNWLYRIATNVCLNAAERKANARRWFPEDVGGSTTRMPQGNPPADTPWIEPLPSAMLENVADTSPGPAARYELRETIRLAFIAATQRLPARQRAVLLLRDVLGWSANETAKALDMSVASVTSALQRARGTLGKGLSPDEIDDHTAEDAASRSIAQDYADSWERADLKGLVSLLAKDASLVMPPWNEWYSGRTAIRSFFVWAFDWIWDAGKRGAFRMVATQSNGQMAFGTYVRRRGAGRNTKLHAHALQVLTIRKRKIQRITIFVGPQFFGAFGMAPELDPV